MQVEALTYAGLEQRITEDETDALIARWEFGRLLLAEREANGGKQIPKGRMAEVCAEVGRSDREIRYRMQFAEKYPTEEEVGTAVLTYGSWTEIRDTLVTNPKPPAPEPPLPNFQPPPPQDTGNGHAPAPGPAPDPPAPAPPIPAPFPPVADSGHNGSGTVHQLQESQAVLKLMAELDKCSTHLESLLLEIGPLPAGQQHFLKGAATRHFDVAERVNKYAESGESDFDSELKGFTGE